jgi:hypothetical protein
MQRYFHDVEEKNRANALIIQKKALFLHPK